MSNRQWSPHDMSSVITSSRRVLVDIARDRRVTCVRDISDTCP